MIGSSASVANPNMVLNTAVAESLKQFYKELDGTKPEEMEQAVHELIKRAIRKHKKVVFNGNGYTEEWVQEAAQRGLFNLVSTPDCLPQFVADKNIELFTSHHIFTKEEIFSRYEILLENYVNTIGIEARTLEEMLNKDFLPIINSYIGEVARNAASVKSFLPDLSTMPEEILVKKLSSAFAEISQMLSELSELASCIDACEELQEKANLTHDKVLAKMTEIRAVADEAEALIPDSLLTYPTYDQLLFSL